MVDEAVVDFMQWFEAKAAERKPVRDDGPKLKKGQTWGPKYDSIADILAEYEAPEPEAPPVDMTEVAALVATMTDAAEPEF